MASSLLKHELLADPRLVHDLPPELLVTLEITEGTQYLEGLAAAALLPKCLTRIFTFCETLFPEIVARWLSPQGRRSNRLQIIVALARVLPLAPYLKGATEEILSLEVDDAFSLLKHSKQLTLLELDDGLLLQLLLSIFRLLSYDSRAFARHVSPIQLQSLLAHANLAIRYLAVRVFCIYMHAADSAMENMLEKYVGAECVGEWEGSLIHYTFLSLWEEKRLVDLQENLRSTRLNRGSSETIRSWNICREDLSPLTAEVAGIVLPRPAVQQTDKCYLVHTETTTSNLRKLAKALLLPKPILVTGEAGSGKTALILDAAREVCSLSSMITLHLNEQTDAKMLLGTYTSPKPGSFSWQPGVLARAVAEGRWLLLEDLDRAPPEVISVIMPLLEKDELLIPSRRELLTPASGFRIITTVRSTMNRDGNEALSLRNMLGLRLFTRVSIQTMAAGEVQNIITSRFPILESRNQTVMAISFCIREALSSNFAARSIYGRIVGLRDMIKFCYRVDRCLRNAGCSTGFEAVSESITNDIFMHAFDCFAAGVPKDSLRMIIGGYIAEKMHISPQVLQHYLNDRIPVYSENETSVRVGRIELRTQKKGGKRLPTTSDASAHFASTRNSLKVLEQLAAAVLLSEPILLVGETGIGKTAMVQHLAQVIGQKLIVINLSQQSESGDLLGGFKPVNVRALAIPMVDEFDFLFDRTFSATKNAKFLSALSKNVVKGNWSRVYTFWIEGVRMAETLMNSSRKEDGAETPQPAKKRKLDDPRRLHLRKRWHQFSRNLRNLEVHLKEGDNKFAFSFVEGKIVQAVRNGEWILLDEVNLASPSTLESIMGLFNSEHEGSPSILLPDSGNMDRIPAHREFRIFAAMNPATDAGKRDLLPGIRSRFTEFYIDSPDNDLKDLLILVKAYLGQLADTDERVVLDVAKLYMEIKQMVIENRLTDGAGQKPHFSIRTLARTLVYVIDHASTYGLRRSVYEGFSMTFLTVLNKDSEQLLAPIIDRYVLGNHKNVRSLLARIPQVPKDGNEYVQFKHYWISKGQLAPKEQPHYIITPFIERNLLNLVRASSTKRFPILLQGPTSSGKTSMIEYLAKISGNNFVRINNHEHTDLQEYLGSYGSDDAGRLRYQEGILVEALRHGHWVVLDELNLAPTDVLEALNRLLDDNRELLVPETQEVIRPHPNFMLFATQNPAGLYGGRKTLSRAFRNRFLELHFDDIPEGELEYILQERSQIAPSFCSRIVAVYKKLSILRQSSRLFEQKNSFATLRDLFRWALRKADDREQLAINGFMLLAERVRNPQERAAVKGIIEEVMKVVIDEARIYGNVPQMPISIVNGAAVSKGIVWTSAMRRLYTLVSRALENDEPVLLVGETGTGKTQLCQALSTAFGKRLEIVNAHMNTEAGDLIGAQRPVRNRSSIEQRLVSDLQTLLQLAHVELPAELSAEVLQNLWSELDNSRRNVCPPDIVQSVQKSTSKLRSLFEWADGSLVNAMKAGHHFLLDEISLADDSVLERLNSVLEPSRTLLLAEKGPVDSLVVASDGFQFLATMNPGGDYGKRELSAALRNRLTEIWAPPLADDDDIVPILDARLTTEAVDEGVPRCMVEFCRWFKETFHSNEPSSISIRDLLTWVDFVNLNQSLGQDSAVLHGASMVFIDSLGTNPAAMVSGIEQDVRDQRKACLEKLTLIFNCDASGIYYAPVTAQASDQSLEIGKFKITRAAPDDEDPEFIFDAPTTLVNAMRLIRAMQLLKPILLEGSPGVGKTTIVVALARAVGRPLTRINLSEQTDLADLFGSDIPVHGAEAGRFAWSDAPFLRAMQKGEWVLLDEMNLASQSVLEGLNACLDHRGEVYVAELDQTFRRHPDFMLFAAQNPHHQGGGRKGLPASFVNRFTVVFADSLKSWDLQLICKNLFPQIAEHDIERLITFVDSVNDALIASKRFGTDGAPWEVNLRDILRWLRLLTTIPGCLPTSEALNVILRQRFRTKDDRKQVSQLFLDIFDDASLERSYYHNLAPCFYQVGLGTLSRNEISQPFATHNSRISVKDFPTVESLLLCVQCHWPSILVGPTGCGKTSLLKHLAALKGANLVEISMNSEIDTMDLVGGFEQVDYQRQISALIDSLREYSLPMCIEKVKLGKHDDELRLLLQLIHISSSSNPPLPQMLEILHEFVDATQDSSIQALGHSLQGLIEVSQNTDAARFEWTDGILIDAIQKGHWVVLDNANLCNSSVLDRLNSLLEPNGALVVNEKSGPDGKAVVVRPHPDFRIFLTMDPRHGELSRAMRNRAVEIFFLREDNETFKYPISPVYYGSQSSMERFRFFQYFHDQETNSKIMQESFEEAFNHLTINDYKSLGAWGQSVKAGLLALGHEQQVAFGQAFDHYSALVSKWPFEQEHDQVLSTVGTLYGGLGGVLGLGRQSSIFQAIIPLINEPFIPAMQAQDFVRLPYDLALVQDLRIDGAAVIIEAMRLENDRQPSRTALKFHGGRRKDTIEELRKNLGALAVSIISLVDMVDVYPRVWETWVISLRDIIAFWRDMSQIVNVGDFESGILKVYISLGHTLALEVKRVGVHFDPLAVKIIATLDDLTQLYTPTTGLSMGKMWNDWRPPTSSTSNQFETMLLVDAIILRFQELVWKVKVPLLELAHIQQKLADAKVAIMSMEEGTKPFIEALNQSVAELERTVDDTEPLVAPYFKDCFRELYYLQRLQLSQSFGNNSDLRNIQQILAGIIEPGLGSIAKSVTRIFSRLFPSSNPRDHLSSLPRINGGIQGSLLAQICKVDEITLSGMDLFALELPLLAKTVSLNTISITSDKLSALGNLLSDLVHEVLASHREYLDAERCAIIFGCGYSYFETDMEKVVSSCVTEGARSSAPYFWLIVTQLLDPCVFHLHNAFKTSKVDRQHLCRAWIYFSLATIQLFVPDHPFDPTLRLTVEQRRYQKRLGEMQTKLQALNLFEVKFTGNTSNMRSEILEAEIRSLGPEPFAVPVHRPSNSKIASLQAIFNSLLDTTVRKFLISKSGNLDLDLLDRLSHGKHSSMQEIYLIRDNLYRLRQRLLEGYREYEDIVSPVVSMIESLDLGLRMIDYDQRPSPFNDAVRYITTQTPFCCADPDTILAMPSNELTEAEVNSGSCDREFRYLAAVGLASNSGLRPLSVKRDRSGVLSTLQQIYERWKAELEQGQEEFASKARMYHYREPAADDTAVTESDVKTLFPTFDETDPGPQDMEPKIFLSNSDPREQAIQLASKVTDILHPEENAGERMSAFILESSKVIGKLSSLDDDVLGSDEEYLTPGLLLSLDDIHNKLGASVMTKGYNFYADANLSEAKKLINIVESVKARFKEIQLVWPEHATLADVIGCCFEILAFSHVEPVAKLLTKAEKLHSYVYQWQAVASKEFSAAQNYDQLTNLLISWRRLELSSWAKLLDNEDYKFEQDAKSWFFIAYETTIAVPLQLVDSSNGIEHYPQQLVSTLETFFLSTSQGQFAPRLRLLRDLQQILELIADENDALVPISTAIKHFLTYYQRFEDGITKFIADGRVKLEKEVKEQIQLASWKDTNISALRESARRSHHNLFKIIRKYRAHLSKLVNLETANIPLPIISSTICLDDGSAPVDQQSDHEVIKNVSEKISSWEQRPTRFKDPERTSREMIRVFQSAQPGFTASSQLNIFTSDVIETSKSLKSQTPGSLSEETKELVTHLKTLKRKFLTEKFRDLKNMGIRNNLGTDILASQASLAHVLSAVTPLVLKDISIGHPSTESYFHSFLDQVVKARQVSREPSEELAAFEVARGAGNVEGLLLLTRSQRQALCPRLDAFDALSGSLETFQSLCLASNDSLTFDERFETPPQSKLWNCIKWLPSIINLGIKIIRIHSNFSDVDSPVIVDGLTAHHENFCRLSTKFDALPLLPSGMTLKSINLFYEAAVDALRNIESDLKTWSDEFPLQGFALRQILRWTKYDSQHGNGTARDDRLVSSIEQIDNDIIKLLDVVLVSIQDVRDTMKSNPHSAQDPAWVMAANKTMVASMKSLYMDSINSRIQKIFATLDGIAEKSSENAKIIGALFTVAFPILTQYQTICRDTIQGYAQLHHESCKMSYILTKSFVQLCTEGFCSPAEPSKGDEQTGKLESGTGLGEGEGAQDISKDVQDDEDLTELAQEPNNEDRQDGIEDQKDALDMTMDDMQGEIGEGEEQDRDDGEKREEESGAEEEDGMDDEVGSVDDLDPSAVDEKLWDGAEKEDQKDSEDQKGKGAAKEDDLTAAQEDAKKEEGEDSLDDKDGEEEMGSADEEGEGVGRKELDATDPHAPEEQPLDLPDEMQLDGENKSVEESDDEGLEDLSDVSDNDARHPDDVSDVEVDDASQASALEGDAVEQMVDEKAAEDDQAEDENGEEGQDLDRDEEAQRAHRDKAINDMHLSATKDSNEVGVGPDQDERQEQGASGSTQRDEAKDESLDQTLQEGASAEGQDAQSTANITRNGGKGGDQQESRQQQAFRKLGDVLEQWHRQHKRIQEASETERNPAQDAEMTEAEEFEHLQHDEDAADTQALGAATEEQSKALDPSNALETSNEQPEDFLPDVEEDEEGPLDPMDIEEPGDAPNADASRSGAFVGVDNSRSGPQQSTEEATDEADVEPIQEASTNFSTMHLASPPETAMSPSEASNLWAHYSNLTHSLSLVLTEQLRLILSPTLATKMRGDFRTGKRLNIKRIIPYIASQYRRDKIWMRRSVPSKRSYQIMLAVDDSKSMLESNSSALAFETLAMVAKALSALEVGDICVVGFGNEEHIRVAHEFGKPFTGNAGANVFRQFGFQQTGTDVKRLVADSLTLFRDARARLASTAPSQMDLWQLELIISDGICEDHDSIRRLVRQAQEERIMIVFIIVDSLAQAATSGPQQKGQSIMDLSQAIFEPDPENPGGLGKLRMKRYLEGFPFAYYLVVRDVDELPGVLGGALKQWFGEVGETG